MKTQNRHYIRKKLEHDCRNVGFTAEFKVDDYPPYTLQRLRVAVAQVIKQLPFKATIRTIDGVIYVKRDTPPTVTVMPGAPVPKLKTTTLLNSMRPWPDDPLYEEKSRYINRLMNPLSAKVQR
jgi:hypothetical protein